MTEELGTTGEEEATEELGITGKEEATVELEMTVDGVKLAEDEPLEELDTIADGAVVTEELSKVEGPVNDVVPVDTLEAVVA